MEINLDNFWVMKYLKLRIRQWNCLGKSSSFFYLIGLFYSEINKWDNCYYLEIIYLWERKVHRPDLRSTWRVGGCRSSLAQRVVVYRTPTCCKLKMPLTCLVASALKQIDKYCQAIKIVLQWWRHKNQFSEFQELNSIIFKTISNNMVWT